MKHILFLFTAFVFFCSCDQKIADMSISGDGLHNKSEAEDSVEFRKTNIEKWYKELQTNYDSVISFAFYMQKDYLELKNKLSKYEKISEGEKLVDELNNHMFSGGDPDHNFSNFANMGEVGHFFEETKKELEEKKIKYHWDKEKARYVLDE